jgi:ribonuclease VapC
MKPKAKSTPFYVLDASAVLAWTQDETGGDELPQYVSKAILSSVNYSEILKKLSEFGVPLSEAAESLDSLQCDLIPFTKQQAAVAASLWKDTKHLGLSFADRACLALALEKKAILVTTDRALTKTKLPLETVLLRN